MEKIELRKARDFGELFNDSISFLRINFKSFFGIIFLLAGPFVILTGLLMGYLQFVSEKLTTSNIFSGASTRTMLLGNSITTTLIFILIFLHRICRICAFACRYKNVAPILKIFSVKKFIAMCLE